MKANDRITVPNFHYLLFSKLLIIKSDRRRVSLEDTGAFGDLQSYCWDQGIKTWCGVKDDEDTCRPSERRRTWEVSDYFETGRQCRLFWQRPQRIHEGLTAKWAKLYSTESAGVCTWKGKKKMFLHKFGLNRASLSKPVLVTCTDYVQYFVTLHSAHGESFWFASHVQFNLNHLLSEQMAGSLYCSE